MVELLKGCSKWQTYLVGTQQLSNCASDLLNKRKITLILETWPTPRASEVMDIREESVITTLLNQYNPWLRSKFLFLYRQLCLAPDSPPQFGSIAVYRGHRTPWCSWHKAQDWSFWYSWRYLLRRGRDSGGRSLSQWWASSLDLFEDRIMSLLWQGILFWDRILLPHVAGDHWVSDVFVCTSLLTGAQVCGTTPRFCGAGFEPELHARYASAY